MEDNLPKGLFGLNKKDVEAYIFSIREEYESEVSDLTRQLQEMKNENSKLNDKLSTLLKEKNEIEASKSSISAALIKAEQQAKKIVDDAREQSTKEKQEMDALIEEEKEKLIDAKIELAMLKDKAKEIIAKFSDDITKLQ